MNMQAMHPTPTIWGCLCGHYRCAELPSGPLRSTLGQVLSDIIEVLWGDGRAAKMLDDQGQTLHPHVDVAMRLLSDVCQKVLHTPLEHTRGDLQVLQSQDQLRGVDDPKAPCCQRLMQAFLLAKLAKFLLRNR